MQDETAFEKRFPYRLLPTNLEGVYAVPAPPDDFDPNTASAASLIKHGIPWRRPKPGDPPAFLAAWERVFSRRWLSKGRIVPVMEPVPGRTHELKSPVCREVNGTNSNASWGGCAISGGPSSWNGVTGFWVIPTVSQPPEPQGNEGGWDSSSWIGLDGSIASLSDDVVQAGVDQRVNAAGQPTYTAWFEWFVLPPANNPPGTQLDSKGYPVGWGVGKKNGKYTYIDQVSIPNFPVTAGQTVMCSVMYNGDNSAADIWFANETTGQLVPITLVPPPTASFNGSSAEWIMENPNGGWPTSSLAQFTQVFFNNAFATPPECGFAGLPGNGDTFDVFSNGIQVTTTSVAGTSVTIDFTG